MAITHGTTIGGGQLARIYDRLRKRGQRALRNRISLGAFGIEGDPGDKGLWYNHYDHVAYVAGVRDALNAVETDVLTLADRFDLGAA